ncbi:hypothetical protein [Desulfomicrobium baculatum]|uniref:hypothetical protein n=1 Tax=Desulfomicrobium baculatum TaxID=899 RepID=UPI00019E6653|nr:hypothetical protein [Desulfomicrobium baculatum]
MREDNPAEGEIWTFFPTTMQAAGKRFPAGYLASNGSKNLAFSDTLDADNLFGRETVNTRGRWSGQVF